MKKHYNDESSEEKNKKTAFVFQLWERALNPKQLTEKEKQVLDVWQQESLSQTDFVHRAESKERVSSNFAPKPNFITAHFRYFAAAAAIIFIATLGALIWFANPNTNATEQQSDWITITTATKEVKTITLPDGSTVTLNNATTFSYRQSEFNTAKREVWLKEGEAFFDVTHNPDKQFIVNYDAMQTVVLGTSFNIKAYQALGESAVTVKTGRVKIMKGNDELGIMTPDRRFVYNHTARKSDVKYSDAVVASAWTVGKLTFSDAPFSEIAMRLKNNFDMDAELQGTAEEQVRLTATFEDSEKLETIADAIAGVNELHYRIEGQKIIFFKKTE